MVIRNVCKPQEWGPCFRLGKISEIESNRYHGPKAMNRSAGTTIFSLRFATLSDRLVAKSAIDIRADMCLVSRRMDSEYAR